MVPTIKGGLPDCNCCQSGDDKVVRLIARSAVQGTKYWLHIHQQEDLNGLLSRLCSLYPNEWQSNVTYNVYVDVGGIYYPIENAFWLRDRDHILVTTMTDISDIPDIDMNAVHASLRDDIVLQEHQEEGIRQMIHMEQTSRGGVLADEMGLGKTLQILATLLRQQPKLDIQARTLIIVPSHGIAHQWTEEIRTKSKYGSLPYFIYQEETIFLLEQPCFKVVITTYDRVRSEYQRRYQQNLSAPLFNTNWYRIVLDECNKLRNVRTKLYDAIVELRATYRWCLTGTPLQNDVSELYPIFRFLDIDLPIAKRSDINYISDLLGKHMIRRKKEDLQNALAMEPRKEIRIELEFTPPERALYDYLEQILYKQLQTISRRKNTKEEGLRASLLYLRLKQDLIPTSLTKSDEEVAKMLNSDTGCNWTADRRKLDSELKHVCDTIRDFYDQCGDDDQITQPDMDELEKLPFMIRSTKVSWLISFLQESLEKSPEDKIVVVSQFVDFLSIISDILKSVNITHESYVGDMPNSERRFCLERFNFQPRCQVLLLSLKAGGVGLNLQCANHMVLLDRWWNPGKKSNSKET
ncbi:SNF2 family N-terminal domain-containing protein [Halteromyces radiatus]|uniref:SNF2 family N-terminal domain-containing protein n=1 Tax=Halteromyces radiatus TaxID=101107 RepID=UPI002220BFD7|nr:SNF2 family N-terminal domain-containing protein [Halteromyces radiatus]KAI8081382.1 SNF2 family N-terminal domain-containing protein [Halteromyces radiatus]